MSFIAFGSWSCVVAIIFSLWLAIFVAVKQFSRRYYAAIGYLVLLTAVAACAAVACLVVGIVSILIAG